MRAILWTFVLIVVIILGLELFITSNIETHSKTPDIVFKYNVESNNKMTNNLHASNITDITSLIERVINNKEWMQYFESYKKKNKNKLKQNIECNELNWMDGLYQTYEPLNKWSFYDNINVIKYSLFSNTNTNLNKYKNTTIILLMDQLNDIDHNNDYNISDLSTFTKWTNLGESSLLIRRIFSIKDIDLIGRFIEWLWAINWIGHIRNDPRCTPKNDHCRDTVLKQVIIENVACWKCGCILEKQTSDSNKWKAIIENNTFYQIASKTFTDKVQHHMYHKLYGKHFDRHYYTNKGVFLEIGLGCNMVYGPGHSGKVWTQIFNNVQFIEYDKNCTEKYEDIIAESGYLVHVGSQDDIVFLEELKEIYWNELGLDVCIDDGGHFNKQIISTFLQLWPILNDNGLYFIEDFQESAYIIDYVDSKPIKDWGHEKPGTAQYFIKKQLLYHLFCSITQRSCYDLDYIECIKDLCLFKKNIIIT